MPDSDTHDIVVVGASMGGLDALKQLLADLPSDLQASVFIVLHTADHGPGLLAQALQQASPLAVTATLEGERFAKGGIYVAPPDRHLLIGHDPLHVRCGPRENGSRPAIDPLFRSAASTCTTRVIGVILTGLLNDGTAGLQAIKRCGGLAVVQHPADAAHPQMPTSALKHVNADHVVTLADMPGLLVELIATPRPQPGEVSEDIKMEALIAAQEVRDMKAWHQFGTLSSLTCPDCHGAMQEIRQNGLVRYRCHTGHAFTLDTLAAIQSEAWERALYGAYRAQHERLELLRRMADEARSDGKKQVAEYFPIIRGHIRQRRSGVHIL